MHEIITSSVPYRADDLDMTGYLARPVEAGVWPAVLIAHDGVGLDDYQRSRADELAARGYVAFAMDFHAGQTFFGRPEQMLARTMPLLGDVDRMRAIGKVALELLLASPSVSADRISALGFGAGGHIALEMAKTGAGFKSIALIHPSLPSADPEAWRGVESFMLLCTGSDDPLCTPQQILTFGQGLQEAGVEWQANVYGGAKHAFWSRPKALDGTPGETTVHIEATVPGVGYHPKHAEAAWRSVVDLFQKTL